MDIYHYLLDKIRLSVTDKYLCNYLLIDDFVSSESNLESIYKKLSENVSKIEAYELIICGLYSIDVCVHIFQGHCPESMYDKHKHRLSPEKLLYIKVYRNCTDENLISFMEFIFNKKFSFISSKIFFEYVSRQKEIPFNELLKENVQEFYSSHIETYLEMDGDRSNLKRKRVRGGAAKPSSVRDSYQINEKRENFCLVFNNGRRKGSQLDVDIITNTFSRIEGFSVQVEDFQSVDLLRQAISKYCQLVSNNSDMIICFFMSHGNENAIYDEDKAQISYQDIVKLFNSENTPKLADKPKILVFQTCRGDEFQEVIQTDCPNPLNGEPIVDSQEPPKKRFVIKHSDFFVIFATVYGCRAMRDINLGSYFIQKFCHIIQEHSKKLSVDEMCTRVNQQFEKIEHEGKIYTQLCEVQKVLFKHDIYLEKFEN